LATIPVLALLPLFGETAVASTGFAAGATRVVAVIAGVVIGGRYLLRPVFRLIARTRSKELFTAAALLLVVGTALLLEAVGLSMALGAFLAGVLLADSEFRHELETDIDPFKGLLLGLFFMAVGMSIDLGLVLQRPLTICALALGFMAVKGAVVRGVGRYSGLSTEASRNMAMVLPQGGEFAFVLFGVAVKAGILDAGVSGMLTVAVAISMGFTPLVIWFNQRFLCARCSSEKKDNVPVPSGRPQVIIAGFGRVGQMVGRVLRVHDVPFVALDRDSDQISLVRRFGAEAYYGDAQRLDLLETAGARTAKVFVLAIDEVESSVAVARLLRAHFPHLSFGACA
jgi:hypothetical protein